MENKTSRLLKNLASINTDTSKVNIDFMEILSTVAHAQSRSPLLLFLEMGRSSESGEAFLHGKDAQCPLFKCQSALSYLITQRPFLTGLQPIYSVSLQHCISPPTGDKYRELNIILCAFMLEPEIVSTGLVFPDGCVLVKNKE